MLLSFKMVSHIASKHYNSIISKAIFTTLYNTESMKGQDDVFFLGTADVGKARATGNP